jgi:hypothetical protein
MSDNVKPWNMIDGSSRSPEEVVKSRMDICNGCEFYRARTNQCKKCSCFMKLKTKLEHAKCPIGKW